MPRRDYSKVAFAATGDTATIPGTTQPDGSVSLPQGFGFDYERDNGAGGGTPDPLAKNIEREDMNGILNEATASIGEIQQNGFPVYVATAAPYPLNAIVRQSADDKNYRSTVTNNNTVPGAVGASWVDIDPVVTPVSPAVVAEARNARMLVSTVAASASFSADEIVVKSALGGASWLISSFARTVNLATVGANGMDAGTAPLNGYVALYAIYNPTTNTQAILATNATAAIMPSVYAAGNMPSGYTASALLTVVAINGSGQFKPCRVQGRKVFILLAAVFTSSANLPSQPVSIATTIPPNAIEVVGEIGLASGTASNLSVTLGGDSSFLGQQNVSAAVAAAGNAFGNYSGGPIITPQTIQIAASTTGASPTFNVYVGGYQI